MHVLLMCSRHDDRVHVCAWGSTRTGSQFFLCTVATPHLNGKHCVFGQVIDGYSVVRAIEKVGSRSGKTEFPVDVVACGQLE